MYRQESKPTHLTRRTFTMGVGAASALACTSPFAIGRAKDVALKVAVLLPRSGVQALLGDDCHRGVKVAHEILRKLGLPALEIMTGDTESNADIARTRAEQMINEGARLLVGAFDSSQSTAIAQVAEQRSIPFIINISAAPQITEQGYKFVFRNFPTAPMILSDAFANQKELFAASGAAPKSVVLMRVNDAFGNAMQNGIGIFFPKFDLPYKITETIAYDPMGRDFSLEVAKAKATGADGLLTVSRVKDAILLTRELVRQRWTPTAILNMASGWYEDEYLKTLGKLSDGPISFLPWYDANKQVSKLLQSAFAKSHPSLNLNGNHTYTFEALLIAADAYKRAGSTDPRALADAIRATDIKDNVSIGPGISFDAKGQNVTLRTAAIQNRAGKLVTVAPRAAANSKLELPLASFDRR